MVEVCSPAVSEDRGHMSKVDGPESLAISIRDVTWKLYCFSFTASWTCLPSKHGWVILLWPRDIALSAWWCPKTNELLYYLLEPITKSSIHALQNFVTTDKTLETCQYWPFWPLDRTTLTSNGTLSFFISQIGRDSFTNPRKMGDTKWTPGEEREKYTTLLLLHT